MRIAVVHSFYSSDQPSGENSAVLDQVSELERAGHDVHLIARHTDQTSTEAGFVLRAAGTTLTGIGPSPASVLDELDPDVVHVHNTFPNWGTRWVRRWRERTVLTLHNFRPVCAAGTLFRDGHPCEDCLHTPVLPAIRYGCYRGSPLASVPVAIASSPVGQLRKFASISREVVAVNEHAQALYRDVLGRDVNLVPSFVPYPEALDEPASRWAFVGRLGAEKGILELVRHWPRDERLDVIGSGPLAGRVADEVRDRPEVRLLGQLSRSQVMERLGTYSGLVFPSLCREGGTPLVVLEAMARGVPSLLSNRFESGQRLSGQGAAVTFDPTVSGDIAAALALVKRAGSSARAACLRVHADEYSPEAWRVRIEDVYKRVASR